MDEQLSEIYANVLFAMAPVWALPLEQQHLMCQTLVGKINTIFESISVPVAERIYNEAEIVEEVKN